MMKRILLGAAALLLVAAIVLAVAIWQLVSPTEGSPIAPESNGTSLVVVDIQRDYTGADAKKPFRDALAIINNTNRLIRRARERGWSVVFIRNEVADDVFHRLTSGGTTVAGTVGAQMDERLERIPGLAEFPKSQADAFSNSAFDRHLRANEIGRVVITGLDAAYCVKATTGGALNRGYQVTVVGDAIATESSTPISKLLEDYRQAGAATATTDAILAQK